MLLSTAPLLVCLELRFDFLPDLAEFPICHTWPIRPVSLFPSRNMFASEVVGDFELIAYPGEAVGVECYISFIFIKLFCKLK